MNSSANGTIDDSVIVAEARGYAMWRIAIASSITTGRFLDGTHAENRDLRLIDDRHAEQCAKHSGIGDGERAARHFRRA